MIALRGAGLAHRLALAGGAATYRLWGACVGFSTARRCQLGAAAAYALFWLAQLAFASASQAEGARAGPAAAVTAGVRGVV